MQKIPTLFVRDESRFGHPVTPVVHPECQWVLDGEGVATAKLDGTNVKIVGGQLFKRQKPPDRDYDEASYVPCERSNPSDKWAFEAFDALSLKSDGIYELVGPKIQGNPQGEPRHLMFQVVPWTPITELWRYFDEEPVRTFYGLEDFLTRRKRIEGIVFHHQDGRMAKIKRRDFGLPWPV